ncbi:pyruvate decarboxylase [Aspergillus clavatus NRRL 1]|uniref:Pyruvate decarboxylase n=1 Tax=Aspergillus clavatus (strain ATCC 1007 / CBS 513.65 / DSM 816 / NCTC 3887 / NRRL 1 / QM 1276 / 107) TaxID=344612 RepID=A1CN58_ASPCL|nr:pyruvate decarboxylase [Aspergillus clavatus NRRL 1]EAW08995.1 pyruvate decarboxylase [Aspergillus clavatus NRRL 1]
MSRTYKSGTGLVSRTCGQCDDCSRGDNLLCPQAEFSGCTADGTFQQYGICKAENAVRIPDAIPLETAAPILCAGVTVYKALKESNLRPGQTVAIVGAGGGLGTLACQYAKACGYRVLALSSGASKKAMCIDQLGVDYFIDYATSPDVVSEVKSVTGGGVHAAIVVATVVAPFQQALEYIRGGGTLVAVGLIPGAITSDIFSLITRKLTIKGSYVGTRQETEEALAVLAHAGFRVQYDVRELFELPDVFESMEQGKLQGRTVLKIPTRKPVSGNLSMGLAPSLFSENEHNIGTHLAYRLEELGALHYFTVPGDFNLILIDQLLKNQSLTMVGCCNELNAGYAADGYARSSPSGIAVIVVTFMVGGLSVINAVAGAYSDRLKVIVISGCPKEDTFGQDGPIHHTLGLPDRDHTLRMFQEVTTAAVRLDTKQNPTELLDRTINRCIEDSLPVYIEIPSDLSTFPCSAPGPLVHTRLATGTSSELGPWLDVFLRSWKEAKKAVVMIGSQSRGAISTELLVALAEKLGCPVCCQPDGKSLFPETHPQFVGTFWGSASTPGCEEIVLESDLWIVLGGRWNDFHNPGNKFDLTSDSRQILDLKTGRTNTPNGKFFGGIPLHEIVTAIVDSDVERDLGMRHSISFIADQADVNGLSNETAPLTMASILHSIQDMLRGNDTLIAETGESWFNSQMIRLPRGADYQMQMMYGSIGWSLPAALGCQLAKSEGRAVLLMGDGSLQMTAQEISTMIRMRANPVIFIFNNLGYRIESAFHDGPYNYIANWNYAALASVFQNAAHAIDRANPFVPLTSSHPGLLAMQIKTNGELFMALERVQQEPDKLAVLECCIHPSDISPLLVRFGQAVFSGRE